MDSANEKNYFLYFAVIILALEATLFIVGNIRFNITTNRETEKIENIQNIMKSLPLEAKAVSVYDETLDKKIYGKNDDIDMPIASLAKIMTVITSLSGHSINDVVTISAKALKQETDYGFFVDEKFKIEDLAKFTLIGSANDGAYALFEDSDNFLQKMNEKSKKIGMEYALFLNPTGLDIDEKLAGVVASANDVNIMATYALKAYPEVFSASVMPEINIKSLSGFNHTIKNTNVILDKIPNILFSKTGLTKLAGGNLVIIYKNKYRHNIAITVLGSSSEGRFRDIEKIIDTLYNLDYGGSN